MSVGRPGRGGRQVRVFKAYETEATRELLDQLGAPHVSTHKGSSLYVWECDPGGDGLICARLSGDDLKKGETAMGQIHALKEMAQRSGVRVRYIAVGMKMSGALDYAERLDFQFVEQVTRRGEITWIGYREPDRIARHAHPAEEFYHRLEKSGVKLYLSMLGRQVDWRKDRALMLTCGLVSEMERDRIVERTHSALVRRWLETGRGWPNAIKFGFRRDAQNFLEVDPAQWPFVQRIHFDYADVCGERGRASLTALREHLSGLGCKFGRERLRQIIRDEVYVTGEWSSTFKGKTYPGRPISIPCPIPAEIFERNQRLLGLRRAANSNTPVGLFLLNRVPTYHAACKGTRGAKGAAVMLRGFLRSPRDSYADAFYHHHPHCPDPCRGYRVSAPLLDELVANELRHLAGSAELQAEYALLARLRSDAPGGALTQSQRETIQVKIANLERQRAKRTRDWLTGVESGEPTDSYPNEELAVIDQEIGTYRHRLDLDDAIRAQQPIGRGDQEENGLRTELDQLLATPAGTDLGILERRAAFVAAALSEVIIHDTDEGPCVELRGPIVPPDSPYLPVPGLTGGTPSTMGSHSGRFRESGVPAWRSRLLPLSVRRPGYGWTYEDCLEEIRIADRCAPPGPLFGNALRRKYRHGVGARPDLGPPSSLKQTVRAEFASGDTATRGATLRAAIIDALGVETALRNARIRPVSRDEVLLTLSWAFELGFKLQPGRGWSSEYEQVAKTAPFLLSGPTLRQRASCLGVSALDLVREAAAMPAAK